MWCEAFDFPKLIDFKYMVWDVNLYFLYPMQMTVHMWKEIGMEYDLFLLFKREKVKDALSTTHLYHMHGWVEFSGPVHTIIIGTRNYMGPRPRSNLLELLIWESDFGASYPLLMGIFQEPAGCSKALIWSGGERWRRMEMFPCDMRNL